MSAVKPWVAYGRLADGGLVVEETRFTFMGTQADAQKHADNLTAQHNDAHPGNPIVRAWPQQLTGTALPPPHEPDEKESRP